MPKGIPYNGETAKTGLIYRGTSKDIYNNNVFDASTSIQFTFLTSDKRNFTRRAQDINIKEFNFVFITETEIFINDTIEYQGTKYPVLDVKKKELHHLKRTGKDWGKRTSYEVII